MDAAPDSERCKLISKFYHNCIALQAQNATLEPIYGDAGPAAIPGWT